MVEDEYYTFRKLIVFGCAESGKTSLKRALDGSDFEKQYQPSEKPIIPNKISCSIKGTINKSIGLNLIEVLLTKDQMNEDIIYNLLYECQLALFMVDLNSSESFFPIQSLIQSKIHKWKSTYPFLKILIAGNKTDLERKVNKEDIQSIVDLDPELVQSIDISLKNPQDTVDKLAEIIYNEVTNAKNKMPLNIVSMSMNNQSVSNGYKLVLLGDSGVGKTAFMNRHFKNEFSEAFLSTIGIDDAIESIKIRNEQMKLQIWDTAGQERFRCLPRKYYQNADGILLLFSFDSRDSFENVSKWMSDIATNSNKVIGGNQEDPNTTTIFLLGNKLDIDNRVVSRQEAEKKAKEFGMGYYEISCKLNINIDEVIAHIILRCYSKSTGVKDCFSLSTKSQAAVVKKNCCK